MNIIHRKRLLKLAAHLEKGKLGHEKFNFRIWNGDSYGLQLRVNGCGTEGCGECPFIFDDWTWSDGYPRLKGSKPEEFSCDGTRKDIVRFFAITHRQADHLFCPTGTGNANQKPERYGGKILYRDATPKQVARNIRAFVAIKTKGRE